MTKTNILPGITRDAEENKLSEVITIAQENLEQAKQSVKDITGELRDMLEIDVSKDKETMVLWNNTQAGLNNANQELFRCQRARRKPYFGRIDFTDLKTNNKEAYYIGRVGIHSTVTDLVVIDWRAPVANCYYEESLGICQYKVRHIGEYKIDLTRKRTYEIDHDTLLDFYDTEVISNDDLLTKYLAKSKKAVLGEIIATIQKEQNYIIRKSPRNNMLVQGVAGSGKTTVAMHRISYILYNYENEFRPIDFYIVGSNRILLNYITSVLPDLDVYGVSQMTMEQLFVRLLYEDWKVNTYSIKSINKNDETACMKGTYNWFHDLEKYCAEYELEYIPHTEVRAKYTNKLLLKQQEIETYIHDNPHVSVQNKIFSLNERIMSRLENEITCRDISYTAEEKAEMKKFYHYFFGGKVWKGNIFDLYRSFLLKQKEKGKSVEIPDNRFDVYDLAALAYIYKRVKETDMVREASHVVIDEAQDFGMMAYASLHYCLRGCTYTIMGDVSQNIHYGYGLNDWEELKGLIIKNKFDTFGLLKKSYRNTVEISNFATNILRHGTFTIYPVEPIIRHGNDVKLTKCQDDKDILIETIKTIKTWQKEGHETIAVICRDEKEATNVTKQLEQHIKLADSNIETAEFGSGVMVLPVEYTKGLEFDAVLLFNPTNDTYPANDGHVKLLYVGATRALHELAVLYVDNLTDLIAKEVPKEKMMDAFNETNDIDTSLNIRKREDYVIDDTDKILIAPNTYRKIDLLAGEARRTGPKRIVVQGKKQENDREMVPVLKNTSNGAKNSLSTRYNSHSFGDVPDNTSLHPVGHARIDSSIRWQKKTSDHVELASNYGLLRIMPITDSIIRVSFKKGHDGSAFHDEQEWLYDKPTQECINAGFMMNKPQWLYKEMKDAIGIATDTLAIRVEKKIGAVQFFTRSGKPILSEREKEPRQIATDPIDQTWMFFDFKKNEKIYARGEASTELIPLVMKARYISNGTKQMRMPLIVSDKGYGIAIASKNNVMCCNIAMYGTYLSVEGSDQIDYYFMYGESKEKVAMMHKFMAKK